MSMPINPDKKPPVIEFGREDQLREEEEKMIQKLAGAVANILQLDTNNLNERINTLEQAADTHKQLLEQLIEANNKMVNAFNGSQGNTSTNTGSINQPVDKVEAVSKLVQSVSPLLDRIFPQQAAPSIIDPEYINEHMKRSLMGNFEVGEAIISGLKEKLTHKAMQQLVKDTITHEPL